MTSIRDIYQWRHNRPRPSQDLHLTPLQELEWREQNSKAIKDYHDKSFVGDLLMASPALIDSIQINKITAHATYRREDHSSGYITTYRNILEVKYEVFYDEALYETVRLIHNNTKVELEGEIINFRAERGDYYIELKLSGIRVTADRYVQFEGDAIDALPAEILDDYFISNSPPSHSSSKCFIATAAFGNQEIVEVIQLREFRDNTLVHSPSGRFFINIYGLLSPPIACLIKQSNWLRKLARMFLRNVVLPLTRQRTIQLNLTSAARASDPRNSRGERN